MAKRNSVVAAQQRRELFVRAYIANGHNAAEAWIAAGGSANGAKQNAYRVLKEPAVQEMLKGVLKKQLLQADITAERTMLELARIAFADVRKLTDSTGKVLAVHELDEDTAAALVGEVSLGGRGGKAGTVRIKSADKTAALGILARHFRIVGSELDETVGKALAFAERLGRARERVRNLRKT